MTKQLYIKTDGPVPEGSEFEIGKLYKAKLISSIRYGIEFRHPNGKDEFAVLRGTSAWLGHMSGFVLCDSTGNPVAAPWEEAPAINWQAHAEALADLADTLIAVADSNPFCTVGHFVEHVYPESRQHVAAFDQAKGV